MLNGFKKADFFMNVESSMAGASLPLLQAETHKLKIQLFSADLCKFYRV